jgi:hypothetical protein
VNRWWNRSRSSRPSPSQDGRDQSRQARPNSPHPANPPQPMRGRCTVASAMSGPVHSERFTSSWPRSQASPGRIGLPQRAHSNIPAATAGSRASANGSVRRRGCGPPRSRRGTARIKTVLIRRACGKRNPAECALFPRAAPCRSRNWRSWCRRRWLTAAGRTPARRACRRIPETRSNTKRRP